MPKERILFELFVIDSNGVLTSCGKHRTEIGNYTYVLNVPEGSQDVSQIKFEFLGEVSD